MVGHDEQKTGKVGKYGTQHKIGLISDLDRKSKVVSEEGKTSWKGLFMEGSMIYDRANKKIEIELPSEDKAVSLHSQYAIGGRGMELSAVAHFNGKLYTVDDRTGIVFEICGEKAIPWVILADGDGRQDKGFKGEWMTVKDGKLYVGGHGKEILSRDGKEIIHKNYQWVKTITKEGAVTHENWATKFDAMRAAAGCPYPGYLTHESGIWSTKHKQWFFLPRKASSEAYNYKQDQSQASNMLIRCSEDFKDIKIVKIGELKEMTRGYSTFKFVPGTDDEIIVAIKSEEIGDAQKSFLTAFTIHGEVLMEDKEFSKTKKYEGLVFLSTG